MKKITLIFALGIISFCAQSQSFTATYSFDSVKTTSGLTDPTAVPTATGVTFGSFSATGVSANSTAAGRFSFTGWPMGATNGNDLYSSMTGAASATKYFSVTVTPVAGYAVTLNSITFKAQRSPAGIRTYSVRSDADGYTANLPASISPANTKLSVQTGDIFFWNLDSISSGQNGSTITLSGSSFINSTSAMTFRFFAWNAETTGTFSIDTVKINGTSVVSTSVSDLSELASVSIYPNPSANGLFTVDFRNSTSKTIITVYDIIGNIVFSKELNSGGKQLIDLSNEANGCYFVNVKNDAISSTKKITINK